MGNMQQSVQRIDHELAHYVYDTLMQSADYTGPSKAELAIRLQQKRTEPDFQEIPAALDLAVKLKEIERTVDLHKRSYGMALEIYTELTKRPWDEPCLATLSASERDFIETLNEEMLADLKAYGHAVNPLIVQGVKIQESVNKAPIVFTGLLRNKKHIEHTEKNLQSIEHYFSLEESFYEKAKEIERITKALGYGPHEQEMQDSDLGKIYDSLVTLAKKKKISLHQPNFREIEKERIYYMFARESEMLVELEKTKTIDALNAFKLYETFGLPLEIIKELGGERAAQLTREGFDEAFTKHQEASRAGLEKKFGGHGLVLNTGELKAANEEEVKIVTRLHTATHLLQASLRKILGDRVHQNGSDITAERLRFDFTFDRKLTPEEVREVEDLVNSAVSRNLDMGYKEISYEEAIKTGALYFVKEKYPATVKVYSATDPKTGEIFSKEFCGGPHVSHTNEVGLFKIIKEEPVGAGVRRIRAIVR